MMTYRQAIAALLASFLLAPTSAVAADLMTLQSGDDPIMATPIEIPKINPDNPIAATPIEIPKITPLVATPIEIPGGSSSRLIPTCDPNDPNCED